MDNKILNNYLRKIESYLDQNEAINILKSIIQTDSRTNSKNENNIIEYWESKYSELGTVNKIHKLDPIKAQTGPARRNDVNIMKMHENMLKNEEIKSLYTFISKMIKEKYGN